MLALTASNDHLWNVNNASALNRVSSPQDSIEQFNKEMVEKQDIILGLNAQVLEGINELNEKFDGATLSSVPSIQVVTITLPLNVAVPSP